MFYTLQFTNVDNAPRDYATLQDAIDAGKKAGFEFSVWTGKTILVSWTIFGGLRRYGA